MAGKIAPLTRIALKQLTAGTPPLPTHQSIEISAIHPDLPPGRLGGQLPGATRPVGWPAGRWVRGPIPFARSTVGREGEKLHLAVYSKFMATFPTAAAKPHATRIRYLIVLVTTLMAVMLYLHRFSLAFAVGYIREDLALTGGQVALVLSAFQLGYALGQVPAGWFGDRWGARIMLSLYILAWSVVTGFMGLAAGFGAVLALRVGCGLAQAGAYPVSAGLLSRWVPFSARAFASAVVSVGGRLGGAIAPILTGYLILAFVPADAPALLQPGDLLDPPALCRRLAAADQLDDSHFARRLLDRLPSPTANIVRDLAAAPPGTQATPGQVDVFVAGLNQVLRDRTLCDSAELPDLKVEAEARRLAERPRETLSESQVERLNRLILEGMYPGQVKKLYRTGWRPVMWVFGAAGVLVAGVFWLVFRNRPEEHPLANAAEVALIESSRPRSVTSAGPGRGVAAASHPRQSQPVDEFDFAVRHKLRLVLPRHVDAGLPGPGSRSAGRRTRLDGGGADGGGHDRHADGRLGDRSVDAASGGAPGPGAADVADTVCGDGRVHRLRLRAVPLAGGGGLLAGRRRRRSGHLGGLGLHAGRGRGLRRIGAGLGNMWARVWGLRVAAGPAPGD